MPGCPALYPPHHPWGAPTWHVLPAICPASPGLSATACLLHPPPRLTWPASYCLPATHPAPPTWPACHCHLLPGPRYAFWEEAQRRKAILKKAACRIKNLNIIAAWNKWRSLIEEKRAMDAKRNRALKHWMNAGLARAWDTWVYFVAWRKEKKKIMTRWMQPMKVRGACMAWLGAAGGSAW